VEVPGKGDVAPLGLAVLGPFGDLVPPFDGVFGVIGVFRVANNASVIDATSRGRGVTGGGEEKYTGGRREEDGKEVVN
jgi:hypothetical protein